MVSWCPYSGTKTTQQTTTALTIKCACQDHRDVTEVTPAHRPCIRRWQRVWLVLVASRLHHTRISISTINCAHTSTTAAACHCARVRRW
jgi:hypothetical protein